MNFFLLFVIYSFTIIVCERHYLEIEFVKKFAKGKLYGIQKI